MSINELVVGFEKGRVSPHGLIQKLNRPLQVLQIISIETGCEEQSLGPDVEIEGGQVGGGRFFDRRFLVRRKPGLQLLGNGFGDLALNGKDIGQIPIVGLRPQMRVGAGIDQLRVHPDLIGGTLDTAFE